MEHVNVVRNMRKQGGTYTQEGGETIGADWEFRHPKQRQDMTE